jgi:hypothetical protein
MARGPNLEFARLHHLLQPTETQIGGHAGPEPRALLPSATGRDCTPPNEGIAKPPGRCIIRRATVEQRRLVKRSWPPGTEQSYWRTRHRHRVR